MIERARRLAWCLGWPARSVLLSLIRVYRPTVGALLSSGCRFYPSCSSYAEQAISEWGAIRGGALTAWRLLRCSPLSAGGVDHPPARRQARTYDINIQVEVQGPAEHQARGNPAPGAAA